MKYKIKEGAVLPSSFKIKVDTEQLEVLKNHCNISAKIEGIYIFHYNREIFTYSNDYYVFRDHDLEEIQFKDYFEVVLDVDANAGGKNIHESWQDVMAKLELDMDAKSMEEYRTARNSIVSKPKVGTMIYCGTGGVVDHEAKRIFINPKD